MKMKLLTFYEGIQFAINPFKFCMRQRKAIRADIFFTFDPGNDPLTRILTYNPFENKCNQLRHLENTTMDTKIVKIGPWTPQICNFLLYGWRPSWIWPKKRVEKFEPYDFCGFWSLMMQYPPRIKFGQTNLTNSIFVTSQPPFSVCNVMTIRNRYANMSLHWVIHSGKQYLIIH